MKRASLIFALLFLCAGNALAAPLNSTHCAAAAPCKLAATKAGDLGIVVSPSATFTDTTNSWTVAGSFRGWYGAGGTTLTVSYSTLAGGDVNITFPASATMLEYPPGTLDTKSAAIQVCCGTGTLGPLTLAQNELLLLAINESAASAFKLFTVAGFTQEDNDGASYDVLDEQVTAGTYSASVPNTEAYGAQLFAFKPVTPPPPPIVLQMTGTVAYDDQTSLFGANPASFGIMQQEGSSWVNVGTPTVDILNNVTGTISINPNFAPNGMVQLEVTLPLMNFPVFGPIAFDLRTFQQGSTGLTLNVVIFRAVTLPKSFQLALTP